MEFDRLLIVMYAICKNKYERIGAFFRRKLSDVYVSVSLD